MNVPLPSTLSQRAAEAAQSRLAQRLAAALTEYQSKSARSDIDARLAFAHDRAMESARRTRSATAVAPSLSGAAGGAAILGGLPGSDSTPWWLRLGSLRCNRCLCIRKFVLNCEMISEAAPTI